MTTYATLNLIILGLLTLAIASRRQKIEWKQIGAVLLILLVLTAVFDSLIIFYDIVAYDDTKLLGINIWKAPIEDLAYTLAAVLLVPYLWNRDDGKD